MTVAVLIPFDAAGDRFRDMALEYVRGRYEDLGCQVVVAGVPAGEPWSKGAAVRNAAAMLAGIPAAVIVADADCVVEDEAVLLCVNLVRSGWAWVQPHGTVVRLRASQTTAVYQGRELRLRPSRVHGPAGGGIVVLSRKAWETVGGPDPRFVGWGGEDVSWARALDTLAGKGERLRYPLAHLWHVPMARRSMNRASPESEMLAGRYYDAAGHPDQMRALVDEHLRSPLSR